MNGSFGDRHTAGLSGHEEIDVINCAVSRFHVDTREIFAATETGAPIVMDLEQIERKIPAPRVDVKLLVAGFLAVARDVPLDRGRDIRPAYFRRRRSTPRRSGCDLRPLL